MEQGEISDDNSSDHVLFELRFPHKSDFERLEKKLVSAINSVLDGGVEIVTINDEGQNCGGVCIRAVQKDNATNSSIQPEPQEQNEEGQLPPDAEKQESSVDCSIEVKRNERHVKEQSPDYTGLSELFRIDTEPATKLDTVNVPSYKRTIKETLDDEELEKKKPKTEEEENCARPARAATECFNCGSRLHSLRDCSKPRNNQRIIRAKRANKHERYHVNVEQRFAHLRPGVISKSLRDAIGLRRGELPFFFYRMRSLGYPPGWLEDAKVSHSGISLFNQNGVEVLNSDEEVTEADGAKHKYDAFKFIDFPGFNADPGSNFFDDYEHHNVPPMSEYQMKEAFIKSLGTNILKGYRQKKLKKLPSGDNASDANINSVVPAIPTDMEIENDDELSDSAIEFERPPPPTKMINESIESLPPLPPTEPPETPIKADHASKAHSQSPSLADLEAQQEQLLLELKAANMSNLTDRDDSLIDEVLELDRSQDSTTSTTRNSRDLITPVTTSNSNSFKPINTPTISSNAIDSDKIKIIKTSHVGTPLLKFSPYDKLPIGDNFKVGVSDVINFENLPDATGKYEEMKLVLQKVRNKRKELSQDDDD